MKEKKINWQKELLESKQFNNKFSKNLLDHGANDFMQGIYLGYMYTRWRTIRSLDKPYTYSLSEESESTHS